jgi:hypothetical protein
MNNLLSTAVFLLLFQSFSCFSQNKAGLTVVKHTFGEPSEEIGGDLYISFDYPLIKLSDTIKAKKINDIIKEKVFTGIELTNNGKTVYPDLNSDPELILNKVFQHQKRLQYPQGISSISHEIYFNDKYILSLKVTVLEFGANFILTDHYFSFDLKTGDRITLNTVFKRNTKQEIINRCKKQIISRLQNTVNKTKQVDLSTFYQVKAITENEFDIDEESLTFSEFGLHLHFKYNFPHIAMAFEPDGEFLINASDLYDFLNDGSIFREIWKQ